MDVLVVGGTGVAGRATVKALVARGHEVRVLSRSGRADVPGTVGHRGDLSTGDGLAQALEGVGTVVDASNAVGLSPEKIFVDGNRRLLEAEAAAGVGHHVLLSIVGIDGLAYAYYRAKLAQEKVVAEGPVPATIQRTTQFHEFAEQMAGRLRFGPVVLVPTMAMRPVAVSEVAEALADAVEAGPAGRARDLRGPRQEQLVDLTRRQLKAEGAHVVVIPLHVPGRVGKQLRAGALGTDEAAVGRQTFDEWLGSSARLRREEHQG